MSSGENVLSRVLLNKINYEILCFVCSAASLRYSSHFIVDDVSCLC
jgi:hypothetical protein